MKNTTSELGGRFHCNLWNWTLRMFSPVNSTADPGNHFKVTAWVPVTIRNSTSTGCRFVPWNNFYDQRDSEEITGDYPRTYLTKLKQSKTWLKQLRPYACFQFHRNVHFTGRNKRVSFSTFFTRCSGQRKTDRLPIHSLKISKSRLTFLSFPDFPFPCFLCDSGIQTGHTSRTSEAASFCRVTDHVALLNIYLISSWVSLANQSS
jgi:hypothetical protein